MKRNIIMALLLMLLLIITSCTNADLKEEIPTTIYGEWKLIGYYDTSLSNGLFSIEDVIPASYLYGVNHHEVWGDEERISFSSDGVFSIEIAHELAEDFEFSYSAGKIIVDGLEGYFVLHDYRVQHVNGEMVAVYEPADYENVCVNSFFLENDISEETYAKYFSDYYTPESYLKACELASQKNANPIYAIDGTTYLACAEIKSYDKNEDHYFAMNLEGEIVKDFGNDTCLGICERHFKAGDVTFLYGDNTRHIFKANKLMNNSTIEKYSLEVGYLDRYALLSDGTSYLLSFYRDLNTYTPAMFMLKENGDITSFFFGAASHNMNDYVIGQISEGLIGIYLDSSCAYYYNEEGECVLDLSHDVLDSSSYEYRVMSLGDFVDGKSLITFEGKDENLYSVYINKEGEFVSEPVLA